MVNARPSSHSPEIQTPSAFDPTSKPNCQLRVENLRAVYPGGFSLHVDHLEVNAGEIICLLGGNGAGKSTLLRHMAGLEQAGKGTIDFQGQFIHSKMSIETRRLIAMAWQSPRLLSGSVQRNIEFGLRLRGADKACFEQCRNWMERLGLQGIAKKPVSLLSVGQQQLVALAQVLVLAPRLLLLDEPTSALDMTHVAMVEGTMREYTKQSGCSVVWVTHSLFQARRCADQAALLLQGELVETSNIQQFFDSPVDPRTRDYITGRLPG
jgi:tungstate transport system ATP-binding protein